MPCALHHNLRTLVIGFASYVAVPALCVLYMHPLNKLTKGVQVCHMFSIPCLESKFLLAVFKVLCSRRMNTGALFMQLFLES